MKATSLSQPRFGFPRLQFYYIVVTAGGFKKIAGKGGGVEYLILHFYFPRGHVKWNVQSIGDIISFRIYDTYF